MKIDFNTKRVLVTGGTRGVGRGVVETFLSSGECVAINGCTVESTNMAISEQGQHFKSAAALLQISYIPKGL